MSSSSCPPGKRICRANASVPLLNEAARTPQACTSCRAKKIKCCGNQPCRHCSKRKMKCVFLDRGSRKMYYVAYVEDLERRVSIAEENVQSGRVLQHRLGDTAGLSSDSRTELLSDAMTSPLDPQPTLSSSHGFGTSIRKLPADPNSPSLSRQVFDAQERTDDTFELKPECAVDRQGYVAEIDWPNEEEAHNLLNTVVCSIGGVQHLIDPRAFSDRLSSFYDEDLAANPIVGLKHVEMLMVFALGHLLQGKVQEGSSLPGERYFISAVSHLPSLCTLRKAGTLAIEVMGLVAFFLQCSDQKDDAYIYAGVALRLAMMNGLPRSGEGNVSKRSEKTHRNRLWWTIYMQERRLAAATSNPVGILDDSITTHLPTDAAGFPAVEALNININLARITGQILQTYVYSSNHSTTRHFAAAIDEVVLELSHLDKEMAPECKADLSNNSITRASATLSLMFSQSMIMATRPVLLHLAKTTREDRSLGIALSESPALQKLATRCIDAAGTSLDILHLLKKHELIAKFGFFDLDAAFSSAFVFMLVESTQMTNRPQSGIQGIKAAVDILHFISEHGNKAAERRLKDVKHTCDHLGILLDGPESLNNPQTDDVSPAWHHAALATTGPVASLDCQQGPSNPDLLVGTADSASEFDWRQALEFLGAPSGTVHGSQSGTEAIWDASDGFNFDFNNDFMLTGADVTDYELFERHISRSNK